MKFYQTYTKPLLDFTLCKSGIYSAVTNIYYCYSDIIFYKSRKTFLFAAKTR